jgi:hypothetical protein
MWNKIQIKHVKQQMKGQKRQCADKAKWEFQPANQVGAMGFNSSISQTNRWTRKHTFQRQYLWTGERAAARALRVQVGGTNRRARSALIMENKGRPPKTHWA